MCISYRNSQKVRVINETYKFLFFRIDGLHFVIVGITLTRYRYAEYKLGAEIAEFPISRYPTLASLCEDVFRNFSLKALQYSLEVQMPKTGGLIRSLEAQYQDEFYRVVCKLLGPGAVSSEWSLNGSGWIDFRISKMGWGIELLRDGHELDNHCGRFRPGGRYEPWVQAGLIKDWLIIDCRNTPPRKCEYKSS